MDARLFITSSIGKRGLLPEWREPVDADQTTYRDRLHEHLSGSSIKSPMWHFYCDLVAASAWAFKFDETEPPVKKRANNGWMKEWKTIWAPLKHVSSTCQKRETTIVRRLTWIEAAPSREREQTWRCSRMLLPWAIVQFNSDRIRKRKKDLRNQ